MPANNTCYQLQSGLVFWYKGIKEHQDVLFIFCVERKTHYNKLANKEKDMLTNVWFCLCINHFFVSEFLSWEAITSISTAFAAIFTAIAAGGVLFAFGQLRVSKKAAVFEVMNELDKEFYDDKFLELRKRTVNINFTNPAEAVECEDLLDFFEKIGCLKKEKLITLDWIYELWGYWILHYWVLCEKHVYNRRKDTKDGTYYDNLESLFNELSKLSLQKQQAAKAAIEPRKADKEIEAYKGELEKELEKFKKEESSDSGINDNG